MEDFIIAVRVRLGLVGFDRSMSMSTGSASVLSNVLIWVTFHIVSEQMVMEHI